MNEKVAQISKADALMLNLELPDDKKVAFQNAQGNEFYTYEDLAKESKIPYLVMTLTPSVISGTVPVRNDRPMFPRR